MNGHQEMRHSPPTTGNPGVLYCSSFKETNFSIEQLIVFVFFFFFLIYFFWLCWVFLSVRGLSPVAASGGHSSSRCAGLSLSRPLFLRSTGSRCAGSVVVAHGPSCSAAMWDLPRPGLEPVSPALASRLSTTAPPGKPCVGVLKARLTSHLFLPRSAHGLISP